MKRISKIACFAGVKVAMLIAVFAVSPQAMTADWVVIQTATITASTPELNQGNTANVTDSTQAINGIALATDEDSLDTGSSQTATLTADTTFELTQGPSVTGSKQAVNLIEAENIGGDTSGDTTAVLQVVVNETTALTLLQTTDATGGDANLQAINAATAAESIYNLDQDTSETGTLTMRQTPVTGFNTQAVNYAKGNVIGVDDTRLLLQDFSVSGATTLTQTATTADGDANVQGVNVADADGSTGRVDQVIQRVAFVNTLAVTSTNGDGATDNVQAINHVRSDGNINNATQSVTVAGSTLTLTSSNATGSTGNVQALNLVDSGGNIADTEQTVRASNVGTTLTFTMDGTGDSNTQAGNMAVIDASTADITGITQLFAGTSGTSNIFTQNTLADNLIQAANLIDLGEGGMSDPINAIIDTDQTFTVVNATVGLTQTGDGNKNLQALNAAVDSAGGTLPVNLVQSLTVTGVGSGFTMTQNNMTGSGQFGNFAGARYTN